MADDISSGRTRWTIHGERLVDENPQDANDCTLDGHFCAVTVPAAISAFAPGCTGQVDDGHPAPPSRLSQVYQPLHEA